MKHPLERTIAQQKKFLIKLVLLQLFFSFLFLFLCSICNAAAIAVSPATLYYEDAQRNTTIEDVITLFNPNNFSVEFQYTNISGFLAIILNEEDNKDDINLDNNINHYIPALDSIQIPIQLTINESIPNGIYEDYLLFKFLASEKEDSLELTAGVGIKIAFNINDNQIINFSVYKTIVEDTEVNSLLKLIIGLKNTGNVNLQPLYNLSIITNNDNNNNNHQIFNEEQRLFLQPYKQQDFTFYYNTTNLLPGKYTAFVSLLEEDEQSKIFFKKELPVQLLSEGTLRRSGLLEQFNITSFSIKEKSKLSAIFLNNGSLLADAKLSVEVYLDNQLQETLASEQFLLEKNERKELVVYYTPQKYGDYKFIAKISYNKKETNQKEIIVSLKDNYLSFFTGSAIAFSGSMNITFIEIVILLVIIISVAYYLAKRK
ncbi:hypothetical protein HZA96_04425 [Candidatus Woesearchaeota archaeon]|nr:hypothetical protein [Candidatus Woesearchaeota archaeon]